MLWVFFAALVSLIFGQLFKLAQRRGHHGPTVVTLTYATMSVLLAAYLGVTGFELTRPVITVGLFTGVIFILSMLALTYALVRIEVAAALLAFRLSIMLPIGLGVFIWEDTLSPVQCVGLALALLSLVLMNLKRRAVQISTEGPARPGWKLTVLLVLAVFVLQGLGNLGTSLVGKWDLREQIASISWLVSTVAAVLGAVVLVFLKHAPTRGEVLFGLGVGVFNILCLVVIFYAQTMVPANVYFPIMGCTVVIMDSLCAHFLWKERLSVAAVAGMLCGAGSMFLVK